MFSFILHASDYVAWGLVTPFLVFFIVSWSIYIVKLARAAQYRPFGKPRHFIYPSVSILVPVYNEKPNVWKNVLKSIEGSIKDLESEVVIVANGAKSGANADYAESQGYTVIRQAKPSKRHAIARGAQEVQNDITIILDSDTIIPKNSLKKVLWPFDDQFIGGVTPLHLISGRNKLMRRMSSWLEDNRFNEVVKGQSVSGAVSCLPGRLFAIRTSELKAAAPKLVEQTFLGMKCVSGDDRFLTSWLLKHGYKTVYQSSSVVYTEAPDTLRELIKQRLRWSRGSMRGTILSLPWLWRYPYTCFMVLQNVAMRWFLFFIYVNAFVFYIGSVEHHWLWYTYYSHNSSAKLVVALMLGLLIGGLFKRLRHLITHPEDFYYYPIFLILVTFVLTPLEWWGNLTCWKQGWLTRGATSFNMIQSLYPHRMLQKVVSPAFVRFRKQSSQII